MLVALHPEGVDRNLKLVDIPKANKAVALHPEGVDRNICTLCHERVSNVALHPEGVDRNRKRVKNYDGCCRVALHPEGVDRNPNTGKTLTLTSGSRPPPGGRG